MVTLDEVKRALRIVHLPGEDADFHTLGGYLMARLNLNDNQVGQINALAQQYNTGLAKIRETGQADPTAAARQCFRSSRSSFRISWST